VDIIQSLRSGAKVSRMLYRLTIKKQFMRRPSYKDALESAMGEDFVQKIIDETTPKLHESLAIEPSTKPTTQWVEL